MDFFSKIYGNEKSKAMFSSLIGAGKLAHAYMISGPCGSGKKTLALAVMASLAATVSDEKTAGRVLEGSCPDVCVIRQAEDKKTMGVDVVREFISTVALSPAELSFKGYIFDGADKLTVQAQNSLLKVIEEPPADVYIFLLCEDHSSMIKTVRSRVQEIPTEKFTPERLKDYFKNDVSVLSSERFAYASRICMGAIGKVKSLITDDEAYKLYTDVADIVRIQSEKMRNESYFSFLEAVMKVSDSREKLSAALGYMLMAYRDIGAVKSDDMTETVFFEKSAAEKLGEVMSYVCIESSAEKVSEIKNGILFNTNVIISAAELARGLWSAV